MKAYAMLGLNKAGWIEKERPACGPMDAIVKPLAVAPCTSDVHTVWEGAIGDRKDMILGHEATGEVVEVGKRFQTRRPCYRSCNYTRLELTRSTEWFFHALWRNAGRLEVLQLQGWCLCRVFPR